MWAVLKSGFCYYNSSSHSDRHRRMSFAFERHCDLKQCNAPCRREEPNQFTFDLLLLLPGMAES